MFYRNNGLATSDQEPYRYTRSADGRESWTPRRSSTTGPKTEMTARNDWPCKFANCGDRTVIAGTTTIVKRDGIWGHKECPKPVERVAAKSAAQQAMDDDRAMAEMEAAADRAGTARDNAAKAAARQEMEMSVEDRADALLNEHEQIQRAAALQTIVTRKLVYRVHLTDGKKYGVDFVNVEVVPNAQYQNAKFGEFRGEGVGRIQKDGEIRYWPSVDPTAQRTQAVVAAVNVLLETADPIALAKAYAIEAQECARCGDSLLDDQNNPYFPYFGPVCGRKFGKGE